MSEHNLLQRPDMIRALQQATGMRQPSLIPTLNTGLQATLELGPVNGDPGTAQPESYAAFLEIVPDAVNVKRAVFCNPLDSGKIAVLRRFHVYLAEDIASTSVERSFVYDFIPLAGGLQFGTIKTGQRLAVGYQGHGGGVPAPNPPPGLDFKFQPVIGGGNVISNSRMGFMTVAPNGIAGGYIWRGIIGGVAGPEILENFEFDHGPRIVILPDGLFEAYAIATDFHAYVNMWWDEYPMPS